MDLALAMRNPKAKGERKGEIINPVVQTFN